MPVVKLDARNLWKLKALAGKRTDYNDGLTPGLVLRVTPAGRARSASDTGTPGLLRARVVPRARRPRRGVVEGR